LEHELWCWDPIRGISTIRNKWSLVHRHLLIAVLVLREVRIDLLLLRVPLLHLHAIGSAILVVIESSFRRCRPKLVLLAAVIIIHKACRVWRALERV
jgi:hypothetical protein